MVKDLLNLTLEIIYFSQFVALGTVLIFGIYFDLVQDMIGKNKATNYMYTLILITVNIMLLSLAGELIYARLFNN